jgi:hypothetical protein
VCAWPWRHACSSKAILLNGKLLALEDDKLPSMVGSTVRGGGEPLELAQYSYGIVVVDDAAGVYAESCAV